MVNLPRRKSEIEVEVPGGATLLVKPMSDPQSVQALRILAENAEELGIERTVRVEKKDGGWFDLWEDGELLEKVQGEENAHRRVEELSGLTEIEVATTNLKAMEALGPLFPVAQQNLRGAEDLEIDGEPFDATREEHVEALPWRWVAMAVAELVNYAVLDAEAGKG